MRIDVKSDRIEGWCNIPGFINEQSVIVFSTIRGKWHVASSMCYPCDIEAAMAIQSCVAAAFDEIDNLT